MGKKRKSETTRLDEVDRSMYTTFCSAANSLSQLYSQASNHQRLSFQAGERHALDKLYQWILRQEDGGSRVATVDIVAYLQTPTDSLTTPLYPARPGLPSDASSTLHFCSPTSDFFHSEGLL